MLKKGTKSHIEFMGPLAVSFFGVSTLHGWLFFLEGMRESGHEVGRIKVFVLLVSVMAVKLSPRKA